MVADVSGGRRGIDSLMTEGGRTFAPPADLSAKAHVGSSEQYEEMYKESINEPDRFWLKQAETLD